MSDPERVAVARVPVTESQRPRIYWPEDKPMPDYYGRPKERRLFPCPNCRRVLLDNLSQAVICRQTTDDFAYMRCKACGHKWKMALA